MELIAHEREAPPKGHDELLDVLNDALFEHAFVNVLGITHAQLFHIDEVEKILVLEGGDGAERLLSLGQGR